MIKKVKIEQLKPGMYVHDFNCEWFNHPFLTNSLKIRDEKMVRKVADTGIKDVYIDTDKGLDIADAPTKEEADHEIQKEINKIADENVALPNPVPLAQEMAQAREIKKEAKKTVHSIMEEVRFGKPIKTEKVEKVVDKMVDSIFRNEDALISLGRIKKTDEYTYMHSMSVCVLMISFGKTLGINQGDLRQVGIGAMLHDIGKMKVPPEILNSRESLSDKEYALMKAHVEHSQSLLNETSGISELSVILATQHHERIDGKGYPAGLKGDEISFYGQAAAIADVYDAMTSKRCYQRRYEPTEVLKRLYEWSGSYNHDLVQQFVRCIGIYPVGSLVRLQSGLLGVIIENDKEKLLQPSICIVYDTVQSRYIMPTYVIDLKVTDEDRIVGYEEADKWNIRSELYV